MPPTQAVDLFVRQMQSNIEPDLDIPGLSVATWRVYSSRHQKYAAEPLLTEHAANETPTRND